MTEENKKADEPQQNTADTQDTNKAQDTQDTQGKSCASIAQSCLDKSSPTEKSNKQCPLPIQRRRNQESK